MSTAAPILNQPPVVSGHWKTVLAIVLIFAFGCFSGSLSMSIIARQRAADASLQSPADIGPVLERRLLRGVDLDENRRQHAHGIFAANSDRRRQLQAQLHPVLQALDYGTVTQIDAMLRPDQRDQFHRNVLQLEQNSGKNVFDPTAPAAPDFPEAPDFPPAMPPPPATP
jgi:hypothetical protein